MSNLTPTANWDNVYQLETADDVLAGAGQLANSQAQSLLNRTEKLKNDLATTNGVVSDLDEDIGDVAGDLATLAGTVGGHTTSIGTINGTLSTHTGQIAALAVVDAGLQTQLDVTQRVFRRKYDNVALNSTNAATRLFTFNPILGTTLNTTAILNQLRFKLNVFYNGTSYAYDFEFDASEHPTSGSIQSRLKLRSASGYQESATTFNQNFYLIVKKFSGVYEFYYECKTFGSGNHTFTLSIYDDDIACVVGGSNVKMSDRVTLASSLTAVAKLSNVSGASNPITAIDYDGSLMSHDSFMQIVSPVSGLNKTPSSYNNDYILSKVTEEPVGTVKMWYGADSAVPRGYAICNGSNGTPDLRDKFVIGAGGALAVGNTGGSNTKTHSGSTSSAGSHTHTGNTNSAGSHSHSGTALAAPVSMSVDADGAAYPSPPSHTHELSINSSGSHSHTVNTNETGSHNHTFTIASYDVRPAFVALFFIMKISRY